jgi:butyrate kinase
VQKREKKTMRNKYRCVAVGEIIKFFVGGGGICFSDQCANICTTLLIAQLPFTTMGSGTLAAMSVLEAGWRENMEEEEAKKLVRSVGLSSYLLLNCPAYNQL